MVATVRILPNGATGGVPGPGQTEPPKRGRCGGWSQAACRRNTEFLRSVLWDRLPAIGYAITLTLAICPETHDDWARLLKYFFERLERRGLSHIHWVTEMQTRMVPHLHGCCFFGDADIAVRCEILEAWLSAASEYGPRASGQHIAPIYDARGWSEYVSKHAARGINHYQRNPDYLPPGWRGITGRMWGKRGQWPTAAAESLRMSLPAWYRIRRMVRSWRKAKARKEGRGIASARRMLRCPDEKRSRVHGWSEWPPAEVTLRFVERVSADGYQVRG